MNATCEVRDECLEYELGHDEGFGIWSGLWSFPEIPVDIDVATHLSTNYRVAADVCERMPAVTHVFTHFALTMHPVRIRIARGAHGVEMPGMQWVAIDRACASAVPAPIRKLLAALRAAACAA